jgi:amino-acid N-acetyltransferase
MSDFVLSKPHVEDIDAMQSVVKKSVEDGLILYRDNNEMSTNIRSYIVAKLDDKIIGFVALHLFSQSIAEVRSLIVNEKNRAKGVGEALVKQALIEAGNLRIKEVLVLTYEKLFFEKLGFIEISKESIPEHKIWSDCVRCKYFPVCNEVSLVIHI